MEGVVGPGRSGVRWGRKRKIRVESAQHSTFLIANQDGARCGLEAGCLMGALGADMLMAATLLKPH